MSFLGQLYIAHRLILRPERPELISFGPIVFKLPVLKRFVPSPYLADIRVNANLFQCIDKIFLMFFRWTTLAQCRCVSLLVLIFYYSQATSLSWNPKSSYQLPAFGPSNLQIRSGRARRRTCRDLLSINSPLLSALLCFLLHVASAPWTISFFVRGKEQHSKKMPTAGAAHLAYAKRDADNYRRPACRTPWRGQGCVQQTPCAEHEGPS